MTAPVRLGARLAWGSPGQRSRSLAVLATSAVGTWILLTVWAVAESRIGTTTAFSDQEVGGVLAAVVVAVALPVFVLAATVGRLSAQLRDRRLANLRLLGLSAAQTRTVAAAEAGLVAAAGTTLGVVLSFALRPVLTPLSVAGEGWSGSVSNLGPPPLAWAVVVVGMPAVTTAIAALPHRLDLRRALERARKTDARRPSAWRALPLALGIALCLLARRANDDFTVTSAEVAALFAGLALVGVGIVVIVPVFVRLVADLLSRVASGPTATLTARRLQAQPAGTTRVIAALMVGLFLVIGARSVMVAFEETPQYVGAADHIENGQRASVTVPTDQLDDARRQAEALPGVHDTFAFPVLTGTVEVATGTNRRERHSISALVASCDQLRQFAPTLTGCSDDEASVLMPQWAHDEFSPDTATLRAVNAWEEIGDQIDVAISDRQIISAGRISSDHPNWNIRPMWAEFLVPPNVPGVEAVLAHTDTTLVVLAGPGRDLYQRLDAVGLSPDSWEDVEYYDFVAGMRAVIWTLATVILSVGLLTFAIAAIDRAVARRRELTSLRLLGTPPALLRRAQWLEAALPTGLGCLTAILSGLFAGGTYLQLESDIGGAPWTHGVILMGIAVLAAAVIAGLTVLGTSSRLSPEHIHVE